MQADNTLRLHMFLPHVNEIYARELNNICEIINNSGLAPENLRYTYDRDTQVYTICDPTALVTNGRNKIMSPGFKILDTLTELFFHHNEVLNEMSVEFLPIDTNVHLVSDVGGTKEKKSKKILVERKKSKKSKKILVERKKSKKRL